MHPVTTLVTTLVTTPDDMLELRRNIDAAIELVDAAIVVLRQKYPAAKS